MTGSVIQSKLLEIQNALKVEKGHYSDYGEYYYRNKEDILQAAVPREGMHHHMRRRRSTA